MDGGFDAGGDFGADVGGDWGGDYGGDWGGDFGGSVGNWGGDYGDPGGWDSDYATDFGADWDADYGGDYGVVDAPDNFSADWDANPADFEAYADGAWLDGPASDNFAFDTEDLNTLPGLVEGEAPALEGDADVNASPIADGSAEWQPEDSPAAEPLVIAGDTEPLVIAGESEVFHTVSDQPEYEPLSEPDHVVPAGVIGPVESSGEGLEPVAVGMLGLADSTDSAASPESALAEAAPEDAAAEASGDISDGDGYDLFVDPDAAPALPTNESLNDSPLSAPEAVEEQAGSLETESIQGTVQEILPSEADGTYEPSSSGFEPDFESDGLTAAQSATFDQGAEGGALADGVGDDESTSGALEGEEFEDQGQDGNNAESELGTFAGETPEDLESDGEFDEFEEEESGDEELTEAESEDKTVEEEEAEEEDTEVEEPMDVQVTEEEAEEEEPEKERQPINSKYANDVYTFDPEEEPDLFEKYPEGVAFDSEGYPDFSPYAIKTVEIDMKGNHTTDYSDANEAAGLDEKPEGYTWHHHQDGKTMLLVPTDLHGEVKHTGGVSVVKHQNM